MTTEQAWRLLHEPMSLSAACELINIPLPNIEDDAPIWETMWYIGFIKHSAYSHLVKEKEIDGSKYFHLTSGDYYNPETIRQLDLCLKDGAQWRYKGNEFEYCFKIV